MSRFALFGVAAVLAAGSAQAQRVEVDPARKTTYDAPIAVRPGETIASEISASDSSPMPLFREEHFRFPARAGEIITVRTATEIMMLLVIFQDDKRREIARGLATDAPLKVVMPRDGTYHMVVTSGGSRRYGKYELSFQSNATSPAHVAEAPRPGPPVQVAAAAPAPAPTPPKPASTAPLVPPALPVIAGITNLRAGQVLARPAGKSGAGVETFQFLAAAGASLYVAATGNGAMEVTLYTPEGDRMLDAEGAGFAAVDAIVPVDGLYFLSVAREDTATPYKLSLAEVEAKLLDADFRDRIGYEVPESNGGSHWSCWLQPGVKSLSHSSSGVITNTYLGGGRGRGDWTSNGQAHAYTWSRRVDGDEIVFETSTGTTGRYAPFTGPRGAYRGYLCK